MTLPGIARYHSGNDSEIGMAQICIIGAGIAGLWQAFRLAQDGHDIQLLERSPVPFAAAASRLAGAMLAPFCEGESAEPWITELGRQSIPLWQAAFPETVVQGSLVIALPRDIGELSRFAGMTRGHKRIDEEIAVLEPALAGRFGQALFYSEEAHLEPMRAMQALLRRIREQGVEVKFGVDGDAATALYAAKADYTIDCQGLAARAELTDLRGVRGEMLVLETDELTLNRPVRLLHPRFPLYVVPWPENRFMIGATVLESAEQGPVTLRSALDLLGTAYALHPAFGEARLLYFAADVRPAFPDNAPRIVVRGRRIYVNGLYRHGFLLAPVLADLVAHYIKEGTARQDVFIEDHGEWRASGNGRANSG